MISTCCFLKCTARSIFSSGQVPSSTIEIYSLVPFEVRYGRYRKFASGGRGDFYARFSGKFSYRPGYHLNYSQKEPAQRVKNTGDALLCFCCRSNTLLKKDAMLPRLRSTCSILKKSLGVWLSLARALRSGRRGRRFKSSHPDHWEHSPPTGPTVGFLFFGEIGAKRPIFPDRGESPLFSYESVFQTLRLFLRGGASPLSWLNISRVENLHSVGCVL